MTDAIAPLTSATPVAAPRASPAPSAAPTSAAPPSAQASPSPAPATPAPAQSPVALSVDRDASGVFVYTLTDRGTGQVLAVIPRALTYGISARPGGEVDVQA